MGGRGRTRILWLALLVVALAGLVVSPAIGGPGFLTKQEAASVFLKKKRASKTFLRKKRANARFLSKESATSTYYSKTETDGRYLRPEGEIRLGVASSEWVSGDPGLSPDYNANEVTFPGGGNDRFALTGSTIPTLLYSRQLLITGVELCYGTIGSSVLDAVFVRVFGTTPAGGSVERSLVTDETDFSDTACRTYSAPAPLTLANESLNVTLRYDGPGGADDFAIRRTTILMQSG